MAELKLSLLFDNCTIPVIVSIQTKEPMTPIGL